VPLASHSAQALNALCVELVEHGRELTLHPAEFRRPHLPPSQSSRRKFNVCELLPSRKESFHSHPDAWRQQGYTAVIAVEESRILQGSIFNTLQNTLLAVDFSNVLLDVITIADEVDSQLETGNAQL
jgi:hypothetical protein